METRHSHKPVVGIIHRHGDVLEVVEQCKCGAARYVEVRVIEDWCFNIGDWAVEQKGVEEDAQKEDGRQLVLPGSDAEKKRVLM